MFYLLWDASALAKRFWPELGRDTVNALFSQVPRTQMVTTILSYSETYAVLARAFHRGQISQLNHTAASTALAQEVIEDVDFVVLGVEFNDILHGIELIDRYHLNSADASILQAFLRFASQQHTPCSCVVVAADQRLLRAAKAEGLAMLNPETLPAVDVMAFLAAL